MCLGDDGHSVDYLNPLAGAWRKGQEFAKSQGWITGYEAYRAYMQRTVAQLESESGERAKYRKLSGSMLLRELRFKK